MRGIPARRAAPLPALPADTQGAAAVEFALVAPVLLLTLMGIFDLGYNMYTDTLLQGAVQKAARDSTIEGSAGNAAVLDGKVTGMVHQIAPKATFQFERRAYTSFDDVSEPEDYNDLDGSGSCDNNEPFEDANGNGVWDADRGMNGFGSARDAVLYTVTITYPRPFPVAGLLGQSSTFSMKAATVLRNQPFDLQQQRAKTGNCT